MIVNIERIVADYLREECEDLIERRVVVTSPKDQGTPWVRLTMLAALDDLDSGVEHLINYLLQIDCYAGADRKVDGVNRGGQPEAHELGQAVRAALHRMPETSFNDAVVTAVKFVGHIRNPDRDGFDPVREREIITARIWAYEAAGVPS